jgi:RNA recognition motif-containing protein
MSTQDAGQFETNKLFVGNLHWHVNRQELKEFFSQWGEVEYCTVMLDRETKKSRGFGFVTFVNAEDAARAKVESQEKELHGRPVFLEFARTQPEREERAPRPEADNNSDEE